MDNTQRTATLGASGWEVPPIVGPNSLVNKRTAFALGDSLIGLGVTDDATNKVVSDIAWWCWACAYLKQRIEVVGTYSQGGTTLLQFMGFVRENVFTLDELPGYLFTVAGGTDILQGSSAATVIASLKLFYSMLIDKGITVVDCTNGPSTSINSSALRSVMFEVNQWKKNYAKNIKGLVIVDAFELIVDGASATTDPATGMTSDGTHYTGVAAQRIGLAASLILSEIVPPGSNLPASNADLQSLHSYGNSVSNGLFDGTGGSSAGTGASGSVSTSWLHVVTGTITSVASKVARAGDSLGSNQRLTISGAGAAATASLFQTISSNIPAGEQCVAQIEVETQSAATEMMGIHLSVFCRESGADIYTVKTLVATDEDINAHGNIILRTLPFTIPAETDEIYFQPIITFNSAASAGAVTVDFGRAELRPIKPI